MTERDQIDNVFTYHPVKCGHAERYAEIRKTAKELALLINQACPESHEQTLALDRLSECVMHANAAIARHS